MSCNTKRTYSSAQKRFLNFCERFGLLNENGSAIPASEMTLLRFVASLSSTCQASSIRVYLSAVRSLHIQNGAEDPLLGCLRIPLVLKGLRRGQPSNRPSKIPITPFVLCAIKAYLNLEEFNDCMLWAACCTAFFGFLRGAEFTTTPESLKENRFLAVSDVSIDKQSNPDIVFIRLRYCKTDQFGEGCTIPLASSDSPICPVTAIIKYLWLRGSSQGPLFICKDFRPLTKQMLNYRLQKALNSAGLKGSYTLHSFRVGAASTAAALGFPDHLIQAMGRWSSDAYKVYIKLPVERLIISSRCLGSSSRF